MLFRAAHPAERSRVLEHFYRLDPALTRAAGFVYACTGREKVVGVEAVA